MDLECLTKIESIYLWGGSGRDIKRILRYESILEDIICTLSCYYTYHIVLSSMCESWS